MKLNSSDERVVTPFHDVAVQIYHRALSVCSVFLKTAVRAHACRLSFDKRGENSVENYTFRVIRRALLFRAISRLAAGE